ncbi:MAG: AraC family transcriptional regulator [Candidatus Devosia phytovorans]|uniref:AraC family transcriptional regulator n=1 Tax=Candidatus Devosia phytovorans TaxID=3121372 RepID=A0AAJ5VTL2_9HYPH|nr:AraC family transcriptional regulator [Devosia sp.]WEK04588.1 MAG: AraC family transcriptional regulator [Devosia sp.]
MDPRIAKAQLLVEQQHMDELSSRGLAAEVGMSEFHFNRLFKSETGTTAAAYIRTHRLRLAAVRLEWMTESLDDIAMQAGYGSLSAFSRAFKAHYGTSPLAYRRGDDLDRRRYAKGWKVSDDDGRAVRIVEMKSRPFVRRRYLGPYSMFSSHWENFVDLAGSRFVSPATSWVGFIYDSPSNAEADQIRYDCGILFPPSTPTLILNSEEVEAGLMVGYTRAGTYAVMEHTGSYARIGETYSQLMDHWIGSQDRYTFTDDPALEVYNNPLAHIDDPHSLRIEIHAPVSTALFHSQSS